MKTCFSFVAQNVHKVDA